MIRLLFLVILAFVVFVLLRGVLAKRNLTVQQFFAIYFATLVGLALLYLGITGRLHPLFAVLGAALPFLFRLIGMITQGAQIAAILRGLRGAAGMGSAHGTGQGNGHSEIATDYVRMVLDHDTGEMDGDVLAGQFHGMKLSNMTLDQLTQLLQEASNDNDSVNLLVAYLDRQHPDWQQSGGAYSSEPPPTGKTDLTEKEALEILGLDQNASKDDIVSAHKRLIQKLHPDRGGSTYLATKINAAKDLLLNKYD